MKTSCLLSILILSAALGFAQNKMSIVGTWKLVSGKAVMGDSTFNYDNKTSDAIKIVTPTHFAVLSNSVVDSAFEHAGAGWIQFDEKNYTEELKYGDTKEWIGQKVKFTYRIEGDKWYVKGGIENVATFDEVLQRVSK